MRERTAKNGITTYQVMFRHGGRQRSKTFDTTKAAGDFEKLIDVLGIKQALAHLDGTAETGITLDQVAMQYWPYRQTKVRSERTVHDYQRDYRNWIADELGWRPAAEIDETTIQDWVDAMATRLSAKSVGDRHAILHGIFKWASAPTRKVVPVGHNPCIGTELPKRHKKAPKGLRPAEWQALHAALTIINADAADLAEFLLASGWRWSEATALTTFDVEDFDDRMWVSMSQVARRNADGSVAIVEDAKSEAGLRRISIDDEAARMIRRRLDKAAPGDLVFTTTEGSAWNYSHFRSRFWVKAITAAKLQRQPTIHWLRHTSVGYLALSRQFSMQEIQRRIGHESIQTTFDVYGGMIEETTPEALDAFAAIRNVKPRSAGAGAAAALVTEQD